MYWIPAYDDTRGTARLRGLFWSTRATPKETYPPETNVSGRQWLAASCISYGASACSFDKQLRFKTLRAILRQLRERLVGVFAAASYHLDGRVSHSDGPRGEATICKRATDGR